MNNVLLSTAPDAGTPLKATPSRTSDSTTSADDASGFAGVLANQVAPQPQNTTNTPSDGTASSGTTPQNKNHTSPAKPGSSPQDPSQRGTQGHDARHAAQQARLTGTPVNPLAVDSDDPATALRRAANAVTAPGTDSADATLPERFSQIIAALPKTAGRHGQVPESHTDTQRAVTPADPKPQALAAELSTHKPDAASSTAQAQDALLRIRTGPAAAPLSNSRTDMAGDASQYKQSLVGQAAPGTDTIVFNAVDTLRAPTSESIPTSGAHAFASATDSLLNQAITAGPAFSLIPGSAQSGDIMATSATINQPLFSKQWGPELGRQFVSLIRPGENGSHIAELRLDPPELGPLRITININDSVVQAMFTSAHASVRSAVEQALPQLQQQLEHEGLSLGHTSVDHNDGSSSQSQPEHARPGTTSGQNESDASASMPPARQRIPDALVDTFA